MADDESPAPPAGRRLRNAARILRGATLTYTGGGHLTFLRHEFQAQVPNWVPISKDLIVVGSGLIEVVLGAALIALPRHRRTTGAWSRRSSCSCFPATSPSTSNTPTRSASTPIGPDSYASSSSRYWWRGRCGLARSSALSSAKTDGASPPGNPDLGAASFHRGTADAAGSEVENRAQEFVDLRQSDRPHATDAILQAVNRD